MFSLIAFFVLSISCSVSGDGDNSTDFPEKPILRYGFQNTHECPDFEKAFICVQKCQDLNYDTAVSDSHCKCTCYMKPEIATHKIKSNTTRDDWKSGAPSTKLPIWAQTTTEKHDESNDEDDTTDNDVTPNGNVTTPDGHNGNVTEHEGGQNGTTANDGGVTNATSNDGSEATGGAETNATEATSEATEEPTTEPTSESQAA